MKNTKLFLFTVVFFLLVALGAFGQETKEGVMSGTTATSALEMKQDAVQPTQEGQAAQPDHAHAMGAEKRFVATVGADGVQHVEITGGSYFFKPNYIIVKVNTPVELQVRKEPGFVPHDIVVKSPEAGIDFKADLSKDWQVIKFTPTKVGTYEMWCDKRLLWFKSHKDRGMDGYIEVVP